MVRHDDAVDNGVDGAAGVVRGQQLAVAESGRVDGDDQAAGREDDWQREGRAEHRGRQARTQRPGRQARAEGYLAERTLVLTHGDLVVGSPFDVVEEHARQDATRWRRVSEVTTKRYADRGGSPWP